MGTLSEESALLFCLYSKWGEFAPIGVQFGMATLAREANRKSQKLFSFVKMVEKYGKCIYSP